jgi:RNA polymerase sigma-70 factor (ECF subfamily)
VARTRTGRRTRRPTPVRQARRAIRAAPTPPPPTRQTRATPPTARRTTPPDKDAAIIPADELIDRAQAGDVAAWRELYRLFAGRLLVWLRTRPYADPALAAEDIASEAWLIAAERIIEFSGTPSDFAGWLFGIARNLHLNAQRKAFRRDTQAAEVDDSARWGTYDSVAGEFEQEDWVRRTLSTLPSREAEVLGCLEVVGLDIAATARTLGISQTAVRVARHRGLRRLRDTLNGQRPAPPSSAISTSASR